MSFEHTPDREGVWEDGLQDLFHDLSGLPTFWRDQERPAVFPQQRGFVTLFVIEDVVVGIPEERHVCDLTAPQGEEIEPTIAELHTITLQVQVETYDHEPGARGRNFASRIRTRLRRESSNLALLALETSLIDISPILSASVPIDNRQTSTSTMIVRLHAATVEVDRSFGFIDVVRLEPSLTGEDGNPIPLPSFDVDLP
jgi:hypothetical protein